MADGARGGIRPVETIEGMMAETPRYENSGELIPVEQVVG
jgi:hypothetical protein